ncbi:hypothetical protein ALISP_5789 [Alicycliphilus sp. B1]|nr:hypothetical protein ALISP_5789 [Alicycliphilus sp. B1]
MDTAPSMKRAAWRTGEDFCFMGGSTSLFVADCQCAVNSFFGKTRIGLLIQSKLKDNFYKMVFKRKTPLAQPRTEGIHRACGVRGKPAP